ncbi:MAG TPA: hypothetical protein VLX92_35140 [Kofleriaceae bacterium]|nr:hypothetical protein [Kofleriaceae bacterium]
MKRIGLVLVVIAGCELQPPPKQQPAPAAKAAEAGSGSAAPAPKISNVPPEGVPEGVPVVDDACIAAGTKVADVLVNDAKDAQQKATLEEERTQIVRRTELACTQQKWSDEVKGCMAAATTVADLQVCEKKIQNGEGLKGAVPEH